MRGHVQRDGAVGIRRARAVVREAGITEPLADCLSICARRRVHTLLVRRKVFPSPTPFAEAVAPQHYPRQNLCVRPRARRRVVVRRPPAPLTHACDRSVPHSPFSPPTHDRPRGSVSPPRCCRIGIVVTTWCS